MPMDEAICAISAIWFIIISCNIIGLAPVFIMSMPGGKPPFAAAIIISGDMPAMACCISGLGKPSWRGPMRSRRLRWCGGAPFGTLSLLRMARGPVGRSMRRILLGWPGEGERAEAVRF